MNVTRIDPPGPRQEIADRLALRSAELRAAGDKERAIEMLELSVAVRDGEVRLDDPRITGSSSTGQ